MKILSLFTHSLFNTNPNYLLSSVEHKEKPVFHDIFMH